MESAIRDHEEFLACYEGIKDEEGLRVQQQCKDFIRQAKEYLQRRYKRKKDKKP
jgi:hypothetical protein